MTWLLATKSALYLMASGTDKYLQCWPVDGKKYALPADPPGTLIVDLHRVAEPEPATAAAPAQILVVNWRDMAAPVSRYFTVFEVTQGDSRRIPVAGSQVERNILRLAQELDQLREDWGSAIGVTSWYRPPAINAAVGGVSNSQHINGGAADIFPHNGQDRKFEAWLDRRWDMALGYGQFSGRGFTHLDLRPGRIRWTY